MPRRLAASGLALLLFLPGQARADEGDLSFITLIGGGLMLLTGTSFCFLTDTKDPGPWANRSLYAGIGMSYAHENFQERGTSISPFDAAAIPSAGGGLTNRRWVQRNDDEGQPTDFDAVDPRPAEPGPRDLPECVAPATSCPNAPGNGIKGEPRPDPEDGPLPPATLDGGAFGADAVMSQKIEDPAAWGITGRLGFRCNPRAAMETHFEWLGEDFDMSFDTVGLERAFPSDPLNGQTELHFRHTVVDSELWTMGANARFFLMTGRIQPYLLGGIGVMRLKESAVRYQVAKSSATGTETCPRAIANPTLPLSSAGGDPNVILPSPKCVFSTPTKVDSDQFKDVDLVARLGGGLELYVTDQLSLNWEGAYIRPSGRVESYDYYTLSAGVMFRFGSDLFRSPESD